MRNRVKQGTGSTETTLRAFWQEISGELVTGPVSEREARLEAGILLAHILGKPRSHLYAHPEATVPETSRLELEALVKRRMCGEPIAYLVGRKEFWSLSILVTRETLIPRPETELLVETLLDRVGTEPGRLRVLELGTGSGAIAAALAYEQPGWRITATDISTAALTVAHRNFHRLGLDNVTTREGSWLAAASAGERFDAIVSNPPYVANEDPHLASGDVRWEPRIALAAGPDGLACLREISATGRDHLVPAGLLALEHGSDQGPVVRELLSRNGFQRIESLRDLGHRERVTIGFAPYQ